MLPEITWIDIFLCILLLAIGVYGANYFKRKSKIESPFFIPLFYIKLIGLAVFLMISISYSNLGDTFKYYEGSKLLFRVFLRSPWVYFKVIFSDNTYLHELLLGRYPNNAFRGDFSFLSMIKMVSVFNTICFNSFWTVSILFCYLSFIGSWMMYEAFKKINHLNSFQSILILFFPSIIFWTSGIMKDSFCYSLLGVLFYLIIDFHQSSVVSSKFIKIGAILLCGYLLLLVKWYVLFAFLGAYFLMQIILFFLNKINIWQTIIFTCFCVLIIIFIWYDANSDHLLTDRLILRIKDFHNWHFLMSNSKYSFGEIDYNLGTLLMYFPEAIFTTLFRPFLWEINSFFLSLSVVESFFLLLIFVLMIFKIRELRISKILNKPLLLWVLFFVILLSYIVGLSSYSFGALSRYRVPVIPFYIFFITTIYRLRKQ